MMNEFRFVVSEENDGERLDKICAELMPEHSRAYLQKLIKSGDISLNQTYAKPSTLLKSGDEVFANIPKPASLEIAPQNIPLDIVYEDSDLIIVNKPKEMVVHPAAGHYNDTLVNAILYHCTDLSGINGILRPGIVHRIDKNTTGLLVICKNDYCHNFIAEQLKEHSIQRTYHAIVCGNVKNDQGTIDAPIGRHMTERKKMSINPSGKNAVTHYKVLKRFGQYTYIECNLETGRTHQIRVHMTSIGHPLLGDEIYGKKSATFHTCGQTLHAKTLGFIHPQTKEFVSFDSDLPEYFKNILKKLDV